MPALLAQLETAISAIDHASQQSLQWVLIAVVVAFAVFAWCVIQYLVRREDARFKTDAENLIIRIRSEMENTAMLREVRDLLHLVKERLK